MGNEDLIFSIDGYVASARARDEELLALSRGVRYAEVAGGSAPTTMRSAPPRGDPESLCLVMSRLHPVSGDISKTGIRFEMILW
jgi:hypothetical protein